jgi:hypothetical protein
MYFVLAFTNVRCAFGRKRKFCAAVYVAANVVFVKKKQQKKAFANNQK